MRRNFSSGISLFDLAKVPFDLNAFVYFDIDMDSQGHKSAAKRW